jgi:hypothetical protein
MNELIEKLKDKNYVRAFGLMKPEEQECFRKVGPDNCDIYCTSSKWEDASGGGDFCIIWTYTIKPEYQPKPEYVDCEIVKHAQGDIEQTWWLGVWKSSRGKIYKFLPYEFTHLHCLPSLPNFEGFHSKENQISEFHLSITAVSRIVDEGKKVYARFRKG